MKNIHTFKDISEVSRFAADKFINIGNAAIKKNGRFTVALAGGSTPKILYQLLATEEYRSQIDWHSVFFFFGDERDVSPMSDRSNFRMANESMLKGLKIPKTNILRWQTEIIDAEGVAIAYEKTLMRFFELSLGSFPVFDLILLGLGEDGHTASLFPQTSALKETGRLAVSTFVEKLDANRLTMTFPVINNAAMIMFLVCGEAKAEALKEVLEGESNPDKYPAQSVAPASGKIIWVLDDDAAALLSGL
ncbi:MAG: 6-phosphogluconolactonase [Acidobacteria bacterium]|nr:6-phosphogluconolactonase [Acidobacteriota bacterium]